MAYLVTRKCPNCGKMLALTPEAARIGVVCSVCKTFVGEKNAKMDSDEVRKLSQAIHEMLGKR